MLRIKNSHGGCMLKIFVMVLQLLDTICIDKQRRKKNYTEFLFEVTENVHMHVHFI